jgi:hypothetical protein
MKKCKVLMECTESMRQTMLIMFGGCEFHGWETIEQGQNSRTGVKELRKRGGSCHCEPRLTNHNLTNHVYQSQSIQSQS